MNEIKKGDEFTKYYLEAFQIKNTIINKYLSTEIIALLEKLEIAGSTPKIDYEKIYEIFSDVFAILLPDYFQIAYNLNKSQELIKKIDKCKPGPASWSEYEKIGIESLRYLLFPEFHSKHSTYRFLESN